MNKQELIEEIEDLKDLNQLFGNNPGYIKIDTVMGLVSKLDEPQKPVVPQFVADWIEECKDDDFHLFGAMEGISSNQKKLDYWFREDNNMELFARAWLDSYTVEEEKRYLVKVIGVSRIYECLNFDTTENRWKFFDCDNTKAYRTHHTRKELEQAGFGWVFDCPGIEIEEVKG